MHMFDAFLRETLEVNGQRVFTDSAGIRTFVLPEELAAALQEPLIAPYSFDDGAASNPDGDYQVVLNSAWASQRMRMLKLLRYVSVVNGGFSSTPPKDGDLPEDWSPAEKCDFSI